MTSPSLQPETIQKLGNAPYAAFAMIAGMQLELFTPLGAGPMHAEQLAAALGVGAAKLTPLLYALVAADLLTVQAGRFANTLEADTFLVRGKPTYLGGRHAFYTARYQEVLQTAATIRTGRPQAKVDFAVMSSEALETFLRGLHPATLAAGRDLVTRCDFASHRHLLDVGGGSGGVAIRHCRRVSPVACDGDRPALGQPSDVALYRPGRYDRAGGGGLGRCGAGAPEWDL